MRKNVLILYGGKSVEHDISIITALQASKNLPDEFDFHLCYISRQGQWFLAQNLDEISIYQNFEKLAKKPRQVTFVVGQDVLFEVKKHKLKPLFQVSSVLNCSHGHIGEDGALQGLLQCSNVAQTSSNVLSSALCMDKIFFKDMCSSKGIDTPEFLPFKQGQNREKFVDEAMQKFEFPVVVKPANLGSSIGISLCKSAEELSEAIEVALSFTDKILVEKAIVSLREFNCACFCYHGKLITSQVAEVTDKNLIFSFEDKYLSQKNQMTVVEDKKDVQNKKNGKLNGKNLELKDICKKVKSLTKKVYLDFDLDGVVRVDFLFDESCQKLFVNEVNTIPGSLAFYLFKDYNFSELVGAFVEESLRKKERDNSKIYAFNSDALKIFEQCSNSAKK